MKKILALVAVASLIGLTACGQSNTAAQVGDVTITQTNLQSTIDLVLKERAAVDSSQMQLDSGEALARNQIRFYIFAEIFKAIATQYKVKISKTEIETTRELLLTQTGGAEGLSSALVSEQIASTNLDTFIQYLMLVPDKISQALIAGGVAEADVNTQISALISKKAEDLKIVINPRYGTWDSVNGDVVAVDSAGNAVTPTN